MASASPPTTHLSPTNASFSVPTSTAAPPSAPSVISSRMTDIASEDNDEYQPEGLATRQSSIRRANDPDRPPSSMSRPSTKATPSRRGTPFSGTSGASVGWRSGGAFGGPGGSISNTSRPQSANSRTSRTHVPSLASQAFFHPMSSQRLQAQRNNRPLAVQQTPASGDGLSETGSTRRRHSLGSNATSQRVTAEHMDMNHGPPPPSRGTEYTEQYDRYTANASPTGNATAQSIGESERPLQSKTSDLRPKHLNISKSYRQDSRPLSPIEKSPNSFRANFFLPAKSNVPSQTNHRNQRWYHPSRAHRNTIPKVDEGAATKPTVATACFSNNKYIRRADTVSRKHTQSELDSRPVSKPGVNYQYFSGNTVFCWGGRLQNARDRPLNIGTATIVIAPSVLFFVFS